MDTPSNPAPDPDPAPEPGPASDAGPAPDPGRRGARAALLEGARFALGTLTVLPVRVERWDREAARRGMVCAPLAGLAVGLASAAAAAVLLVLGVSPLVAAVAAVAGPAALTRGLHLDGLADVADGLGSGRPAQEALRVMKQSDIGPFGVLTLVLVLLAQVAVVAELYGEGGWAYGALGVTVAAVTARTALTLASRAGMPAARPDGLGATVAGTVPVRAAYATAAAVTALAAGAGALTGAVWGATYGAVSCAVACAVAVVAGIAAAELLLRHCRSRLGGVTGDVFGALAETAATGTLLVLALG